MRSDLLAAPIVRAIGAKASWRASRTLRHATFRAAALAAICAQLVGTEAWAGSGASVRAVGMGGAFTALARGLDAPQWNPANLALATHPRVTVGLLASAASLDNNSIGLRLYNRTSGAVLTEQDKADILASIPADGLAATADASTSVLGLHVSHIAVTFAGRAAARTNLPHDAFTLLLSGNGVADSVAFEDAAGEAYAVASAGISGATTLWGTPQRGLHVGLSLRYLQGIAYGRIDRVAGALVTRPDGVRGEGLLEVVTAGPGSGVGADVGIAATWGGGWTAGFALENAFAQVAFERDLDRRIYTVALDTLTLDALDEQDDLDSYLQDGETSVDPAPFTVTLPRVLSLGLGREGRSFSFGLEARQGFQERAGSSTTPLMAAGVEARWLRWLPLRLGAAVGGASGQSGAAGFGLELLHMRWDFAAATHGGFWPSDPRGVTAAVGLALTF